MHLVYIIETYDDVRVCPWVVLIFLFSQLVVNERNALDIIDPSSTDTQRETDGNLVASIISTVIQIPIIIIESTQDTYVRPFIPMVKHALADRIIYLAHNVNDHRYYNTKEKGEYNRFMTPPLTIYSS